MGILQWSVVCVSLVLSIAVVGLTLYPYIFANSTVRAQLPRSWRSPVASADLEMGEHKPCVEKSVSKLTNINFCKLTAGYTRVFYLAGLWDAIDENCLLQWRW